MDESNKAADKAAETPAAAPVVPPVSEPKPVVPTASKNNSNGVVPAGKPGSSKGLIIGLCCGGAALILIVVLCIIFIPMLFGIDWEKSKEAASNFKDAYSSIDSDCGDVMTYAGSTYKTESEYDEYVNKCQEAVNKYKTAAGEIGKASAVKKDKDIKEKYEKFKASYDKTEAAIEQIPVIFKDVHAFMLKVDGLYDEDMETISDEKIDEIVKPLVESENEALRNMGNDMASQIKNYISVYKTYVEARQLWYDTSYSDPNYNSVKQAYENARDAYYDTDYVEPDVDIETLLGITEDDLDDLDNAARDLYNEIMDKYRENN